MFHRPATAREASPLILARFSGHLPPAVAREAGHLIARSSAGRVAHIGGGRKAPGS